MSKLRLPRITRTLPDGRVLSMDQYLQFVIFNLRYAKRKNCNRNQRKYLAVNVPFFLS